MKISLQVQLTLWKSYKSKLVTAFQICASKMIQNVSSFK